MTTEPPNHASLLDLRNQLLAESSESAALVTNLRDNPVCQVSVDTDLPCINIRWKRYVTSTQLRYVLEQLLWLLDRSGGPAILGDDSALPTIHAEDQRWIAHDWMPRAHKAGLKFIASKQPHAHWVRVAVREIKRDTPAGIDFQSFDDLNEARTWLRSVLSH